MMMDVAVSLTHAQGSGLSIYVGVSEFGIPLGVLKGAARQYI